MSSSSSVRLLICWCASVSRGLPPVLSLSSRWRSSSSLAFVCSSASTTATCCFSTFEAVRARSSFRFICKVCALSLPFKSRCASDHSPSAACIVLYSALANAARTPASVLWRSDGSANGSGCKSAKSWSTAASKASLDAASYAESGEGPPVTLPLPFSCAAMCSPAEERLSPFMSSAGLRELGSADRCFCFNVSTSLYR